MINRRQFAIGAASLGLGTALASRFALAKPSQPSTGVAFDMPKGACDCHVHIHGPRAAYPMYEKRSYTPEEATPSELEAMMKALGLGRVVIVTPSVYGANNASTMFGMMHFGPAARGVAVIDAETTQRELKEMAAMGIRGVRLNLSVGGVNDPDRAKRMIDTALEQISNLDWHLQLNTKPEMIEALHDFLGSLPKMIVFDHYGGAQPDGKSEPAGFGSMVDLVASGKAYAKISIKGGHRDDLSVFDPLADKLIAANSDRILWGSNWPHPNAKPPAGGTAMDLTPLFAVDDGRVINQLGVWAENPAMRQKILVDNPVKLYGFA